MSLPDPLVIVPARGGSKRLPRKNLRRLGGLSLLGWTIQAARDAGLQRPPLLSTEDDEIAAEGRLLGYWVPFMRPPELASDSTTTAPVVLHALDWCKENYGHDPELIMLLQTTSPFRQPSLIIDGLARMRAARGAEALVAVAPLHVTLSGVFIADGDALSPAFFSDDNRRVYAPTGALYIMRSRAFRRHGAFIPPGTLWIEHAGISTLDIDTPDDWALAEAMLSGSPGLAKTNGVRR